MFRTDRMAIPLREIRTVEIKRSFLGRFISLIGTAFFLAAAGRSLFTFAVYYREWPAELDQGRGPVLYSIALLWALTGLIGWVGDRFSNLIVGTNQRDIMLRVSHGKANDMALAIRSAKGMPLA